MYRVPGGPIPYVNPWDTTIANRLRMLRLEARRIAYYYEQPDSSTFRYRCYSMVQAVNAHVPGASAAWFCAADGVRLLEVAREVDNRDVLDPLPGHRVFDGRQDLQLSMAINRVVLRRSSERV